MEIVSGILIAAAPSVLTGFILKVWDRKRKQEYNENCKKEELQKEYVAVQLEMTAATAELAYAVAAAYKRGHANGEMESAMKRYEKAMAAFRSFEMRRMAEIYTS